MVKLHRVFQNTDASGPFTQASFIHPTTGQLLASSQPITDFREPKYEFLLISFQYSQLLQS
jgi:hypothetical protein